MKKFVLSFLIVIFSIEIFAIEFLDSLPCYCINLAKFVGNDETELLAEEIKALEDKNVYYSERKGCWAEFLVPVKPANEPFRPHEKPLPMFVANKLAVWGYRHVYDAAQSYMARAKCYTIAMGKELFSAMRNDTALARPFFNYIYERYYGNQNKTIREHVLVDMGFTYPEIDLMEEIGYAHYKVVEDEMEHPTLSREELIKEGFEAEKALETKEIKMEDLEKNPYYTGKLEFESWSDMDNWKQHLSTCTTATSSPCRAKLLVHVDKKGVASLECQEDNNNFVKCFCDYLSQNGVLKYKPAYLLFPSVRAKVRVPCTTYINIIEQRDFDRIAVVKVVFKNKKWELAPDTQLPSDWKKDDTLDAIRTQLGVGKTKKTKLTLNVQLIKRQMLIGHFGKCPIASLYQIVSSNDKKLQFEKYEPSHIMW